MRKSKTAGAPNSKPLQPDLELGAASAEESAAKLLEAEQAMQEWQQQWDEFNQRAAAPRQQAEVQQSRIQHIEQALRRFQERIAKLEQEKQGLGAADGDDEIELLNEQLAEIELQVEEKQHAVDTTLAKIEEQRDAIQRDGAELDRLRSDLQSKRGRRASLEALQQAALGQQGGVVNEWLKQHNLADKARLAERLQVEGDWQKAVETVLGEQLQAVCVDSFDALASDAAKLGKGRLTLLDSRSVNAGANTSSRARLSDQVRGDFAAGFLAGIYCADSVEQALALRAELQAHESVITRDGLWFGPNWLRVARGDDAQSGVLARQQELSELIPAIEAAAERIDALAAQLAETREQLRRDEQLRDEAQRELQQINRHHGEVRSELSAKQVRIEQTAQRREQLNREIDEAREQFSIEEENVGEARLLLQTAIDSMQADATAREADVERARQQSAALEECAAAGAHRTGSLASIGDARADVALAARFDRLRHRAYAKSGRAVGGASDCAEGRNCDFRAADGGAKARTRSVARKTSGGRSRVGRCAARTRCGRARIAPGRSSRAIRSSSARRKCAPNWKKSASMRRGLRCAAAPCRSS